MNDANARLFLPAIALAEACWAVFKGKTAIGDWRQVVHAVRFDPRVTVIPLTTEIIELAMTLPASLEMHDSQILACAIHLQNAQNQIMLLTLDRSMVDSGLVPVVW